MHKLYLGHCGIVTGLIEVMFDLFFGSFQFLAGSRRLSASDKHCICTTSHILRLRPWSVSHGGTVTPKLPSRGAMEKKLSRYCRYPPIFEIRAPQKKTSRQRYDASRCEAVIFKMTDIEKKRWEGSPHRLRFSNSNYTSLPNHHPFHTLV